MLIVEKEWDRWVISHHTPFPLLFPFSLQFRGKDFGKLEEKTTSSHQNPISHFPF